MAKNTKPAIRFKGFTDAWEQRKLSGIYQNIGNAFVGTATPYYVEDGHFYLESNNIKDGQINRNSEIFINDEFYEKQKDKWLHTGDMVMVQSGHVGHAAVIPEELDNSAAHALIMFRNPKEKVNPYFLNYQYQTNKAKKKIEGITTGNTIKHILASDMQEFVVDVPDFEEQEIIGAYFQQLDNLITLHQRKYDSLVNVKKAMLEKMFPKNGETVPEIRFKGFTDAWEQRKLSSLCEKFTDGDWIEAKDQSDSGVRLIQTGNVGVTEYLDKPNNKKWVTADTFERLRCEEVLPGDILISRLPEPAGRACIMPNLGTKMITAVDCTIVRTFAEYSSKFLVQFLSTHDYFNEVNTALAGGTRQRISRSNLASFDVPTPPTFEEQEAIGNYFKHLDHLITLHQRKLEKLKNIKKSCLEKMFV